MVPMLLLIGLKLIIGLIALLLVVRLLVKKSLSEITPFDLIYTLVLGGILEESIYDDKVHLGQIIFALFVWAVLIYIIEQLVQKNRKFNRLLKSEPAVLIKDGVLNKTALTENHIEMEQLRAMLRQEQCFSVANVQQAVLETAGQISVLTKSADDQALALVLVDE